MMFQRQMVVVAFLYYNNCQKWTGQNILLFFLSFFVPYPLHLTYSEIELCLFFHCSLPSYTAFVCHLPWAGDRRCQILLDLQGDNVLVYLLSLPLQMSVQKVVYPFLGDLQSCQISSKQMQLATWMLLMAKILILEDASYEHLSYTASSCLQWPCGRLACGNIFST